MVTHIKTLGTLHIVFGVLGAALGMIALLFFGGLAGLVGMTDRSEGAYIAIPILSGIGGIIFLMALAISLPCIIAGIGLLRFRPWARILTLIISVINLFNVPLGTLLGFYGFWVLLSGDTERIFAQSSGQVMRI